MTSNEIFDIPIDNPFQNDKLDRKNIAENLENIIDSINGSVVLSIDASWGNGKTTFIKMWKQKIDNEAKYKATYFNAWEDDDCEEFEERGVNDDKKKEATGHNPFCRR